MATAATCPVQKDEVLSVLEALKFKDVRNETRWPGEKLLERVNSLHKVAKIDDFVAKIADADVRKTAELLVKAGKRGDVMEWEETEAVEEEAEVETEEEAVEEETEAEVEAEEEEVAEEEAEAEEEAVEEEAEAEEEPEPAPKTPKKEKPVVAAAKPAAKSAAKTVPAKPAAKAVASAKTSPAKAAAPKKEAAEKDKFGMRTGTRAARINAAIDGTPRTPKEICELAKYDKTIHNHLKKLVEQGYVQVVEGKYSVKGAKAAAKPAVKKVVTAKK